MPPSQHQRKESGGKWRKVRGREKRTEEEIGKLRERHTHTERDRGRERIYM